MSEKKQVPTLAEQQIDLSGFQLIDVKTDQKAKYVRPHGNFPVVARQVNALYPEHKESLKLGEDYDPEEVETLLQLAEDLEPYQQWLERRLEQVKETRLVALHNAYKPLLKLYHRTQAAAEFDESVGHAFSFLSDYFRKGKKK